MGRNFGYVGIEMDVGNEREVDAFGTESVFDFTEIFGFFGALGGVAEEFGASLETAFGLRYRGFYVVSVGVGHGLYANGVVAPDS